MTDETAAGAPRLECFFDLTSPWTFLGVTGLRPIAARHGVEIRWRPILVGGVFNEVNQGLYSRREAMLQDEPRFAYYLKDLSDWARLRGADLRGMPPGHPVSAVRLMRGCYAAAEQGLLAPYMNAGFAAYWTALRDVSDPAVLREIAAEAGLEPDPWLARIEAPEIKSALREATAELVARGGFGSPAMFVNGSDMYFGQDRLELVDAALRRAAAAEGGAGSLSP